MNSTTQITNVLRHSQPLKVEPACRIVREYGRRLKAISLVNSYFPQHTYAVANQPGWPDIVTILLDKVDSQGWFAVDWSTVQYLLHRVEQAGFDELLFNPEGPENPRDQLALTLDYIPLQRFGFDARMPLPVRDRTLKLLHILLGNAGNVGSALDSLRLDFQLPPAFKWEDIDQVAVWHRLQVLSQFQPQPMCWLEEAARYATGLTGNLLLDRQPIDIAFGGYLDTWRLQDYWSDFFWEPDEVEYVRSLYRQALVVLDRVRQLCSWASYSNPRLLQIFSFLTNVRPGSEPG